MRLKKTGVLGKHNDVGDVFAIRIGPGAWGYCRLRRGIGIEVPFIFTTEPGLPKVDWASPGSRKSVFHFWGEARDGDPVAIPVGNVPFASDEDASMPPTYRDPDNSEPRYTIEEKGMYRYTSDPSDLRGIQKRVVLNYATLGKFLTEQYQAGALARVDLVASTEKLG